MTANQSLLIAIPCYNCEKQIPRVIHELTDAQIGAAREILVIDNGSSDKTIEYAIEALRERKIPNGRVVQNRKNVGLGGSHKVAFLRAEKLGLEWLAIIHGDNQARSDELGRLQGELLKQPYLDAVLGSRFMPTSQCTGYSKIRTVGNKVLNQAYSLLTQRTTWDLGSGLNLFRVKAIPISEILTYSDGFTFNMDFLLGLYSKKAPIEFTPISWRETDQVSNAKAFRVGLKCLTTLIHWTLGRTPSLAPNGAMGAYETIDLFASL